MIKSIHTITNTKMDLERLYEAFDSKYDMDSILKELHAAGYDINTMAKWPNDRNENVTMLFSAVEFRREEQVSALLKAGADVNALSECGDNIIDYLLQGHSAYDFTDVESCENILKLLIPYNPPRCPNGSVLTEEEDHPYLKSQLICDFLKL